MGIRKNTREVLFCHMKDIHKLIHDGVKLKFIADKMYVTPMTLHRFIKRHDLKNKDLEF